MGRQCSRSAWWRWWGLCWLLLLAGPAGASAAVPDHDLRVTLMPDAGRLAVRDRLTLPVAPADGVLRFALDATLALTVDGRPVAPRSREGGLARYALPLAAGQRTVTLDYAGPLRGTPDCDWLREPCRKLDGAGVFLGADTAWYPWLAAEAQTHTLRLTLPAGWRAVNPGRQVARETLADGRQRVTWRSDAPLPGLYLLAGPFARHARAVGGVQAEVLLRDDDPALAERYLAAIARYLPLYEERLGPYPYPRFTVVESFWETGWGMPSFTLLGGRVLRLPFIVHTSLPHELLHNWWGNGVFVAADSGNWSEGLTAYLADHYLRERRGQGADYRRDALQKYADYVRRGRDFPLAAFRSRHSGASEAVGYAKGLMVFHMLRREVGEAHFWAALRTFYRQYRFRPAGFDDIAAAFSAQAGRDLGPFFDQWVQRPGAPHLVLAAARVEPAGDGRSRVRFTLSQDQAGPPFTLRVPLRIERAAGPPWRGEVLLRQRRQDFAITLDGRATRLVVDPDFDCFRLLDAAERPASLGQVFGSERLVLVHPPGADWRAAAEALAGVWRRPGRAVTVQDDGRPPPATGAVVLLGRANRLATRWPRLAAVAESGALAVDGRTLGGSGQVLVLAVRDAAGRPALWLRGPREALAGLGRRLPHYGKYSYLAFAGGDGRLLAKGRWPVGDSPLVARLTPAGAAP